MFSDTYHAASDWKNDTLDFMTASWVWDRCNDLSNVLQHMTTDERKKYWTLECDLHTLMRDLRKAASSEASSPDGTVGSKPRLEARRSQDMWEVFEQYKAMFIYLQKFVKIFVPTDGLDWQQTREELERKTQHTKMMGLQQAGELASNNFAVALSALLSAIHKYLYRYVSKKTLMELTDGLPEVPDFPALPTA